MVLYVAVVLLCAIPLQSCCSDCTIWTQDKEGGCFQSAVQGATTPTLSIGLRTVSHKGLHKGLPGCISQLVEARKAATRRSRCERRNDAKQLPYGTTHPLDAKRSKQPHVLGHPVGHPLWCGPCQRGLLAVNPPLLLARGVGGYNHRDSGEEGDWRPPLLYANP